MDPFNEVKDDAYAVVHRLEALISQRISGHPPTTEQTQDFGNNYEELQEMRDDLQSALEQSAKNPSQFNLTSTDISERQSILQDLNQRISQLSQSWHNSSSSSSSSNNKKQLRDVTSMSNRISQDDDGNPFNIDTDTGGGNNMTTYQQQELIQEQDVQLDDIHKTMMNLNQQATMMGDELEDQGFMLDELDYEMDNVGNKLDRGMKRLNVFIERNRETASNWCIGVLVVVLCVLLVLLIVA
ncbi:hypothetical protein KGF57_003000 [Candida theae]|uniref:t-SNARE affecting a late Golgi compartment protein 1 n=1 Tax=Candida theae TaxID=1198502 RepID=A0AAD5BDW3_9ASCO|nr:uncharacterized protein KGF57_003000 [Candida theae]KAI5957734.1 hypothetical protein KGF57_003000 [Candida theae]